MRPNFTSWTTASGPRINVPADLPSAAAPYKETCSEQQSSFTCFCYCSMRGRVCDCAPLSCHWTTTLLVISINSVAKPESIECSLQFHVTHVTVVLIENDLNLINHRYDIGYFKFRRGFVTNLRVRLLHRKF